MHAPVWGRTVASAIAAIIGAVSYFTMEYIPGAWPITTYTDEHKLDTQQRLALFAKVCDAVHQGHQRGAIHRDLKPGNVLVDTAGSV